MHVAWTYTVLISKTCGVLRRCILWPPALLYRISDVLPASVTHNMGPSSVACSDGGAGGGGGGRHTLAPKKRGVGEKDVDLRPHTYVRTRGAKYRC